MSDEAQGVSPEASPPEGPSEASAAWREVVAQLDSLGEAIGRWAKAAVNDPDNKRRVDELSLRMDGFVSDVTTTVKGAADSEVGQSFREAADKTGEAFRQAGGKLSDELGPRLSGAFKSAAERLGEAAERMEDRARREPEPGEAPEAPTSGEADATDGV
jgi:hypothetical protein